jgi:hypothetical protein
MHTQWHGRPAHQGRSADARARPSTGSRRSEIGPAGDVARQDRGADAFIAKRSPRTHRARASACSSPSIVARSRRRPCQRLPPRPRRPYRPHRLHQRHVRPLLRHLQPPAPYGQRCPPQLASSKAARFDIRPSSAGATRDPRRVSASPRHAMPNCVRLKPDVHSQARQRADERHRRVSRAGRQAKLGFTRVPNTYAGPKPM